MDEHVYPAEPVYQQQYDESGDLFFHPPVMEDLKVEARKLGLWNLFLPDERFGAGLTNLEYAPLAEITGRSFIASRGAQLRGAGHRATWRSWPSSARPSSSADWLEPLLEGEIRSCFAMTEPDGRQLRRDQHASRASSATATSTSSTAASGGPAARLHRAASSSIFMGLSNPDATPTASTA